MNDSLTILGRFDLTVSLFFQRLLSGIFLPCMGFFIAAFLHVPLPVYLRVSQVIIGVVFAYSTLTLTMSPTWSILRNLCVAGQGVLCVVALVQHRHLAGSHALLRHLSPIAVVMAWLAMSGMLGLSWTSMIGFGYLEVDLFLLVLLAIVIGFSSDFAKRVAESQQAESRLRQELSTASRIQNESLDTLSGEANGWRWQVAYAPSQEVGGDFYQVIQLPAGGLLVLVGDVSGKGLAAALNVSEILGAFRALCAVESQPGRILAALNSLLRQRKHAGFVTACCLHLQHQQVTIANAGHLPPYLDGKEFAPPSSLPLGILTDAVYPEHTTAAQHVLLLTDGIPEARNSAGELFGFTRTLDALPGGAAPLVETASTWGQDDDMTVLELRYAG